MGRDSTEKLTDGYTFVEVLITISLMLIITTAVAGAYISFVKGQQISSDSLQEGQQLLQADRFLREKTAEIHVDYWENPVPVISDFIEFIITEQPVEGVVFTKTDYLFDEDKRVRGIQFYYNTKANGTEYISKCLFSFIPIISLGVR